MITGEEILKRAPGFFSEGRLKRFQHCFDRLEYVFPEIDWKDVSVEELREAVAQAVMEVADGD